MNRSQRKHRARSKRRPPGTHARKEHRRKHTWRVHFEVVRTGSLTITAHDATERDRIFDSLSLDDLEALSRNHDVVITEARPLGMPHKEVA